jgi:DNA-binding LacI/PurR family transcriptional regulator
LQKVLWTRGIRGVIIPPHPTQLDWGKFDFTKFTGVFIGYSQATPRLHRTSSDQIGHTMLAWEKMTDLGYRRIGFWGQASPTRRFISGFLHSQQSVPSAQRVPPLMLPPGPLDSHSRAMARWSARHKPDAILSDFRDSLMMCRMAGLDVPKTIGLAVLSVRDGGADAGIDQHPAEIGMTAVRELFSLMHTRQQGIPAIPHATLVSGTWVDGDSLPRRSTASKS